MEPKIPPFVLVKSTNPYNDGRYGRAGLRFTREWRLLKLAAEPNPDLGEISAEQYAILDKDTLLAVKPATAAEVETMQAELAQHGGDKDAQIDALRSKNADLEARLLKLELAVSGDKGKGASREQPPKS